MDLPIKYKHHIFFYDRREILVLTLLIIMLGLFAFTLGVHLGKRAGGRIFGMNGNATPTVTTTADQIPSRLDLGEKNEAIQKRLEETLNHELHQEVAETGILLNPAHQVELPTHAKDKKAGATTLEASSSHSHETDSRSPASESNYTLQIGSFPTMAEAKIELQKIEKLELKPFLREVEVKNKGVWYRIYLGEFSSRTEATKTGELYHTQHKIDSFLVSKLSK